MTQEPQNCPSARAKQDGARAAAAQRVTLWGMVINIALAGLKFAAGTVGHSHAVVADAVHSLSDTTTDLAILVGARYWAQPADASHPHGHGRIETVVTIVVGLVLVAAAFGIALNALGLLEPGGAHGTAPGWVAFAAAVVSVFCKEGLYQWTARVGRNIKSRAVIANAWHHRSDALSSIPAAVAVAAAAINPAWTFVDALGAVVVALFILQAAGRILFPALGDLIDRAAPLETVARIHELAETIPGVHSVHALRTRSVGPGWALDLHVLVDGTLSVHKGHDIAKAVKKRLLDGDPDVVDVIVHIEPCPCDGTCHHPLGSAVPARGEAARGDPHTPA